MVGRWEYAERRASTIASPFEPATEPAPISLTGPATAHPFRYAPAPSRPAAAAHHSAFTVINLAELAPVHSAKRILEALLIFQRDGAQCRDLSVVVNLLLDPAGKLDLVRRGIAFAVRLKGAARSPCRRSQRDVLSRCTDKLRAAPPLSRYRPPTGPRHHRKRPPA